MADGANRGVALSTAGVTVGYAVETTAGTRPTSGYTAIPDIKSTPELNPEPEAHEATDLEETEYKFYVAGLKAHGSGSFQNMVQALAAVNAVGSAFFSGTFHAGDPQILLQAGQKPVLLGHDHGIQIHMISSLH